MGKRSLVMEIVSHNYGGLEDPDDAICSMEKQEKQWCDLL
jgi:hypothetical protein